MIGFSWDVFFLLDYMYCCIFTLNLEAFTRKAIPAFHFGCQSSGHLVKVHGLEISGQVAKDFQNSEWQSLCRIFDRKTLLSK